MSNRYRKDGSVLHIGEKKIWTWRDRIDKKTGKNGGKLEPVTEMRTRRQKEKRQKKIP